MNKIEYLDILENKWGEEVQKNFYLPHFDRIIIWPGAGSILNKDFGVVGKIGICDF